MVSISEDSQGRWFSARSRTIDPVRALLIVLLFASFGSLGLAAFRRFLNGDEYIFLSQIYRAWNHWPIGFSQTAYVHLFSWWLPYLGTNEADQIVIGRLFFVAVWAGSLWLLYRLALRLLEPTAALAGVTLYTLFSYSVMSAASFRVDGLLVPSLLAAAWFLIDPNPRRVAMAGVLSGVALALSLKASLWAPALAGVLAVGLPGARQRIRSVAAGSVGFAGTYALILAMHSRLIATGATPASGFSEKQLAHVGGYMLFGQGLLPKPEALTDAVIGNLPIAVLLAIGMVVLCLELKEPAKRGRAALLICLTLPMLSVLFYANAFPYAYVYLMPGCCLVAGKAFARYADGATGWRRGICLAFLAMTALPLVFLTWQLKTDQTAGDRQLLAAVHRLFPKPVPYIDLSGLVASFPRPVTVITKLGLAASKARGIPGFCRLHPPRPSAASHRQHHVARRLDAGGAGQGRSRCAASAGGPGGAAPDLRALLGRDLSGGPAVEGRRSRGEDRLRDRRRGPLHLAFQPSRRHRRNAVPAGFDDPPGRRPPPASDPRQGG